MIIKINGHEYTVLYHKGGNNLHLVVSMPNPDSGLNIEDDVLAHVAQDSPLVIEEGEDDEKETWPYLHYSELKQLIKNYETNSVDLYFGKTYPRYDDKEALIILTGRQPSVAKAIEYRKSIEIASDLVDDETALTMQWAYAKWMTDTSYEVGNKRIYNDILYKCLISHTSQSEWTPDVSPSLWAKVLNEDPVDYPIWEQPGSSNAYMIGDIVWYPEKNTKLFESLIDNNVWSPDLYPAGWKEIETPE